MAANLIYINPKSQGKIYQAGWKELPTHPNLVNIDVVVLAAEELQQPPKQKYSIYPAKVIRVPLDDEFNPSTQQTIDIWKRALAVAQKVVKYNNAGKNIIISCAAGWNRSGLITGFTLQLLTKQPANQVIKHIQKCRPNALGNPAFLCMLRASESLIKNYAT